MEHDTAGDPVSGLKWTRRTTAGVAAELHSLGIQVSARTVARLLKTLGFSLRVNHKKLAGASHPDRDAQFRCITELREDCTAQHIPIVSVDTGTPVHPASKIGDLFLRRPQGRRTEHIPRYCRRPATSWRRFTGAQV